MHWSYTSSFIQISPLIWHHVPTVTTNTGIAPFHYFNLCYLCRWAVHSYPPSPVEGGRGGKGGPNAETALEPLKCLIRPCIDWFSTVCTFIREGMFCLEIQDACAANILHSIIYVLDLPIKIFCLWPIVSPPSSPHSDCFLFSCGRH